MSGASTHACRRTCPPDATQCGSAIDIGVDFRDFGAVHFTHVDGDMALCGSSGTVAATEDTHETGTQRATIDIHGDVAADSTHAVASAIDAIGTGFSVFAHNTVVDGDRGTIDIGGVAASEDALVDHSDAVDGDISGTIDSSKVTAAIDALRHRAGFHLDLDGTGDDTSSHIAAAIHRASNALRRKRVEK